MTVRDRLEEVLSAVVLSALAAACVAVGAVLVLALLALEIWARLDTAARLAWRAARAAVTVESERAR